MQYWERVKAQWPPTWQLQKPRPEYRHTYVLQTDSGAANVGIIKSGPIPQNPSELLVSVKMKELLEALMVRYDMIIMDSPPNGIVTDAAILSAIAGGVVLVCAAGKTKT